MSSDERPTAADTEKASRYSAGPAGRCGTRMERVNLPDRLSTIHSND